MLITDIILVSVRTFGVMYEYTFFLTGKSPGQTSGHTYSWLSVWWMHMVTLIFIGGLCGYIWVNMLTLSPPWEVAVSWLSSDYWSQDTYSNSCPNKDLDKPNVDFYLHLVCPGPCWGNCYCKCHYQSSGICHSKIHSLVTLCTFCSSIQCTFTVLNLVNFDPQNRSIFLSPLFMSAWALLLTVQKPHW